MTTSPLANIPRTLTLHAHGVRLEPLTTGHAQPLLALTPPDTFRYFLSWPSTWDAVGFSAWIERHTTNPKTRAFAVIDDASARVVGSSAYLDIDPPNRALEIGSTWYAPEARGTRVNPAAKLLLLDHAFDHLACARVTLKCDARNEHSQRAIAKLGAQREGTLRKHRIQPNGFVRDTVYFSVLPDEWPRVREGLLARLASSI